MSKRLPILIMLALVFAFVGGSYLAQEMNIGSPDRPWPDFRSDLPGDGDDEAFDVDDDEFADDVAGSYYLEGTLFFLDPGGNDVGQVPLFGLQTFGADGTLVSTDNGSFNNPANPQSPGHGSWVRTGPLQVRNTGWIYLFGDFAGVECPDPPPPLPYCLLAVPVGDYVFAPDFETGESTFRTGIWLAGDNPAVDPPLVPFSTARGEATLTRIPVSDPVSE